MIKRKARSVPIYQGHNFMFVSKDMGNVDYLRTCGVACSCTCVWYMHVCACVHACVQRPEKDAPHPFLPFNKSLTELGIPFFFPARLAGQEDSDPPVMSLSLPPSTGAIVLCGCGCATSYVVAGIQTRPFVLVQQALCPVSCLLSV